MENKKKRPQKVKVKASIESLTRMQEEYNELKKLNKGPDENGKLNFKVIQAYSKIASQLVKGMTELLNGTHNNPDLDKDQKEKNIIFLAKFFG